MEDTTTIDYLNKKIIEKKITHQNIKLYQGLIFELINKRKDELHSAQNISIFFN